VTMPSTEAPSPRRIGPPEIEALHEIDQIIGNQDIMNAEELGRVRGIVLTTLNNWHQRYADSNLVAHAERELELAEVEEDVRPSLVEAVGSFIRYGHSGGSASVCIPLLADLLQYRALSALTSDPSEWQDMSDFSGYPVWQNVRDSQAFSEDGGRTYRLLCEERRKLRWLTGWLPWAVRRRIPTRVFFPQHTAVPRG
jgi:hypothetical protein